MTDETPPKDPSAIVIPFGKYRGKTVAELLVTDPQYADWVTAQAWFAQRFAELHAAMLSRGAGADDSPEHNALQARFLTETFREAVIRITRMSEMAKNREHNERETKFKAQDVISQIDKPRFGWDPPTPEEVTKARENLIELAFTGVKLLSNVCFEEAGVDVVVQWGYGIDTFFRGLPLTVELKPTLGDDYPTVLRQMQRLKANVLVVGAWAGRGVTEPQMRAMFQASGINVVFVQEIEEQMRLASEPRP